MTYIYNPTSGGSFTNLESFCVTATRNSVASNIYLSGPDGTFMNKSPFILPFDATLVYLSVATDGNETWTAEIHVNGVLKPGATLSITNNNASYGIYNIDFNAGDKIMLYCNGTAIFRPRINAIFIRR